jgi:hypothetical protein
VPQVARMEWTPLSEARQVDGFQPWRPNLNWEPLTAAPTLKPTLDSLGTVPSDTQSAVHRDSFEMHWLQSATRRGPGSYDINELADIVDAIEIQLQRGQFDLLGAAIAGLPLDLLSPHVIVAIFRIAASARERIPKWTTSVAAAEAQLRSRSLPAQRLLRGIL